MQINANKIFYIIVRQFFLLKRCQKEFAILIRKNVFAPSGPFTFFFDHCRCLQAFVVVMPKRRKTLHIILLVCPFRAESLMIRGGGRNFYSPSSEEKKQLISGLVRKKQILCSRPPRSLMVCLLLSLRWTTINGHLLLKEERPRSRGNNHSVYHM